MKTLTKKTYQIANNTKLTANTTVYQQDEFAGLIYEVKTDTIKSITGSWNGCQYATEKTVKKVSEFLETEYRRMLGKVK